MDEIETSVATAETSFGKEIIKSLAISTATSVGVLAGFVVVGYTYSKLSDRLEARKAKKNQTTEEN